MTLFLIILIALLGGIIIASSVSSYKEYKLSYEERMLKYGRRLVDLTACLSLDEYFLYSKIFDKIKTSDPKTWKCSKFNNGTFSSIKIDNITLDLLKINKYECSSIIVSDKKNNIRLYPDKEQFEIFDLFGEIALYRLENLYEEYRKKDLDYRKKEFADNVIAANKILKF